MKPSGPGFLLFGNFLITVSILLGIISLFRFSDLFLVDCMFLEPYPFCPGCPVCWHVIVHNIFFQSFVFLWCQLLFLFFHFWFHLFEPFLFQVPLSVKLDHLFELLSCFFYIGLMLWISLLGLLSRYPTDFLDYYVLVFFCFKVSFGFFLDLVYPFIV